MRYVNDGDVKGLLRSVKSCIDEGLVDDIVDGLSTAYETSDVRAFLSGEWVDSDKVQAFSGMGFNECFSAFDFSRSAEWWSVVGKTDGERQSDGQKIITRFRLKNGIRNIE